MGRGKNLLIKYKVMFTEWLKRGQVVEEENVEKLPLVDLAPNGDNKMTPKYVSYIKYALRNSRVFNIALSGIYGSGKSSIIESLKNDVNNNNEFKYLDISLANFNSKEIDQKDLEDNLEKAIVKQILYSGDRKKRPQSRFKGITNIDNKKNILESIWIFILLIIYLYIFKSNILSERINTSYQLVYKLLKNNLWTNISLGAAIILIVGITITSMYYILKWAKVNLKFNKIKIFNSEIQSIEDTTGSSFNKYIDEILYFFEVNDYNVVIFEDLDRFDNIDIFTKLRELNKLIKSCVNIEKEIKFIYAIKDDLFFEKANEKVSKIETGIDYSNSHKNRTKFFDFIIPVIPIVNHSNSVEKIKDRLDEIDEKLVEKISLKFIKKLSFYIDDMRLLNNIINEFYIYSKGLNVLVENTLFHDKKLFAMITYKNLYPNDFDKLQVKNGFLYDILTNKKLLMKEVIKDLNKEIEEVDKIIETIEYCVIKSKDELVKLYCANIVSKLAGKYQIYISNSIKNILEITSNEFEEIINSEQEYQIMDARGSHDYINVREIKNAFNTLEDYSLRVEREYNKDGLRKEDWISKRRELENRKKVILGTKLKNLLKETDIYREVDPYKNLVNNSLLTFLLKEGHIDESYNDCLTYFYPGSLSEVEKLFVKSINSNDNTGFNNELKNMDNILDEIYSEDFIKDSILNQHLIFYIINNKTKYYDEVINKLGDNSNASKEFTVNHIDELSKINTFIIDLSMVWDGFWKYIYYSDLIEGNIKKVIFINLIFNLKNNRIKALNKDNSVSIYLESMKDFLSINLEQFEDKIEELLNDLNTKFTLLEFNDSKMQQFILKNKLYKINTEMISNILRSYNIEELSYTNIINSKDIYLVEYIDKNMELFINDVYLTLSNEVYEDSENILKILNTESLKDGILKVIVDKVAFEISEIDKVKNKELWSTLFNKKKVALNWDNLLYYYGEYKLDSVLIDIFNTDEAVSNIIKEKLNTITRSEDSDLDWDIIYSKEIKDKSVIKLIGAFSYVYEALDLGIITSNRIKELIDKNLVGLSNDILQGLVKHHHSLFIEYILNNLEEFISSINEFSLDGQDIIDLLSDNRLENEKREQLINRFTVGMYVEKNISEDIIAIINNLEEKIAISEEFILELIDSSIDVNLNLNLLDKYWGELYNKYIRDMSLSKCLSEGTVENIKGDWINNESLTNMMLELITEFNVVEKININVVKQLFSKTSEENLRIAVIFYLLDRNLTQHINELISLLNPPYSDITNRVNQVSLECTDINLKLVEKLKDKKLISSFKIKDNILKVYPFRNNKAATKKELMKC